jgi:hypothetical protein
MRAEHNRAFKEWAVACEAMRDGRQILLIRKGGIREEGGTFVIADREFFLMPTYEHQKAALLQPDFLPRLEAIQSEGRDPQAVRIECYAVVEAIQVARDEAQVQAMARECIWNADYIRDRFNFNPYDPLYLLALRVYRLPAPIALPMRPEYVGCKSWVTLEPALSTAGAIPALSDAEFEQRRNALFGKEI